VSMRESYHADCVGPLVIVVSDQLDEVRVQQHRGADVHNAGALVVIEIRTDCLILSVSDNVCLSIVYPEEGERGSIR